VTKSLKTSQRKTIRGRARRKDQKTGAAKLHLDRSVDASLHFLDFSNPSVIEQLAELIGSSSSVLIVRGKSTELARIPKLLREHLQCNSPLAEVDASNLDTADWGDTSPRKVVLLEADPDRLSGLLHVFIDTPVDLIAPRTDRYFCGTGLVVNTIPKAGTHLLTQFLADLGMVEGGSLPERPAARTWYVLDGETHVSAKSFVSSLATAPLGGYGHLVFSTPMLFLYRHPLAILVSMARYLGEESNNALNHFMRGLSLDKRLDELIESPLLGKFSDRIDQFSPWLALPSVIPISFEELIGKRGNGSSSAQQLLLWSLQLKLHIPGSPIKLAAMIGQKRTATLRIGTIDSYRASVLTRHMNALQAFDQAFMTRFGYDIPDDAEQNPLPRFAIDFRRRQLRLAYPAAPEPTSAARSPEAPALLSTHRDFNIVHYSGRFIGLRQSLGEVDITVGESNLSERFHPDDLVIGASSQEVMARIDFIEIKRTLGERIDEISRKVESISAKRGVAVVPALVESHRDFNVVQCGGRFLGLRQSLGEVDVTKGEDVLMKALQVDDFVIGASPEEVKGKIDAIEMRRALERRINELADTLDGLKLSGGIALVPEIVSNHRGFNIIRYGTRVYGLRQSLGPVDLTIGEKELSLRFAQDDLVVGANLDVVGARIDLLELRREIQKSLVEIESRLGILESRKRS